jgi:hypothetical protein
MILFWMRKKNHIIYFCFSSMILINFCLINPLSLVSSFFAIKDLDRHKTTVLIVSRMEHDRPKILNKWSVSFNKRYKTNLNLLDLPECLLLKDDRPEFLSLVCLNLCMSSRCFYRPGLWRRYCNGY